MKDNELIVKQLDHLVVRVDNPKPLFRLLSETLNLPVAWPLRSYPSFTSGGVTFGNLYLEIISCAPQRDSSQRDLSASDSTAARFVAMAFEAESLDESLRELDRRGIPHGPLTNYVQLEDDGSSTQLYANVILGKLLGGSFWLDTMILLGRLPGASAMANPGKGGALVRWGIDKVMNGNLVFLVKYSYGNFRNLPHWSEFSSHEEKCAADRAALAARQGGALGIESVEEIIAGVKDVEDANTRWRRFLAPQTESAPHLWEIADGPRVRLFEASDNQIQTLVLRVSSLKRAASFLTENEMMGSLAEDQLTIAPEKIYGLDVRLVEGDYCAVATLPRPQAKKDSRGERPD
jgi:hypothetical protein